jgi:hypothetical protein
MAPNNEQMMSQHACRDSLVRRLASHALHVHFRLFTSEAATPSRLDAAGDGSLAL